MSPETTFEIGGSDLIGRVEPLWQLLQRHHAGLAKIWTTAIMKQTFAKRIEKLLESAKGGLLVVIARHAEIDVGYAIFTKTEDADGVIESMYVDEKTRGKGVGTQLAQRGAAWFREKGVSSIVADVHYANHEAMEFYKRLGFRQRSVRFVLSK